MPNAPKPAWYSLILLCGPLLAPALMADAIDDRARELTRSAILVDTHIDVPYRLHDEWQDVTAATEGGDFDAPRARAGGLDIPFMSIYLPAASEDNGTATQLAHGLIDSVEAMVARSPERFVMVASVAQAREAHAAGRIGLAMGMENGAPIAGDLEQLQHFYQRGIRYITLTHSKSNHIADSSYDEARPWGGLSPFGEQLVRAMNDIGMMVDISHVSDEAFYDTLATSRVPVIASHSSARHFTPGFERNMSDEMIVALAENGGVIQINFGSSFLTKEANDWYNTRDELLDPYLETNGFSRDSDAAEHFIDAYKEEHPFPFANVSMVADHIDHVVALVGIEHVGIGSDYDGVGDSLPSGLKSVADYPALVAELLRRDYSEADIEAILGNNLLRVWQAVENAATTNNGEGA